MQSTIIHYEAKYIQESGQPQLQFEVHLQLPTFQANIAKLKCSISAIELLNHWYNYYEV